jgi:Tol biopolymer transport system component
VSDLWLMDRDGGNARRVYAHDQPGVLIQSLIWAADGRSVLYTYTAPVLGPDGRYVSSLKEVQRLDVTTGGRARVVKDAQDPGFAPGGGATPLAYVLVDPQTYAPGLWSAGPTGTGGQEVVGAASKFLTISGPRFSPDGKTSSSPLGRADCRRRAAGSVASNECLPGASPVLVEPFFPRAAAAHAPPPISTSSPWRAARSPG